MNPNAMPKRNICRYFAASGSCFYGDSCQFQHVSDNSISPPGMMRGAAMPAGPPLRTQSAGQGTQIHIRHPGESDCNRSLVHKVGYNGVWVFVCVNLLCAVLQVL